MNAVAHRSERVSIALATLACIAIALWIGGLLTLGAIVAPIVFHNVPAPASADAMTLVFRRFDRVAMACVVVVFLVEIARAFRPARRSALDAIRVACAVAGGGLAVWQGVSLSPRIEALHRSGAIRGLGEGGLELDAVHHLAELSGKAQSIFGIALVALNIAAVATVVRTRGSSVPTNGGSIE